MMEIRHVEDRDREAVERFVARIPDGDRTFFKEDVADPDVVAAWVRPGAERSVALDDGEVVGYVALVPLQGWSSHVGEVRVIVDPDRRGHGIGRALARYAVLEALELGLTKIVVEVVADQERDGRDVPILRLPSRGAARATRCVTRPARLRDLMILAHSVEELHASMTAVGLADDA